MAYLHLQDGGLTPTAGIEKQEYSHIVADSYSALMAYEPERGYENLEAVCADGATYTWNGTAWAVSVINNGATYVAQHPTMQATSVRPTDLLQIDRNGNSMVANSSVLSCGANYRVFGALGDSITAQASSCVTQAAQSLGYGVALNKAVGGSKIEQQAQFIPNLISAGCDSVFIQVGTNNWADDKNTLYQKYVDLYTSVAIAGLKAVVVAIPPLVGYAEHVHVANTVAQIASKQFGFPFYDPWYQFGMSDGTWSTATENSDGTHPVSSVRKTASITLADLIQKKTPSNMVVRANGCSMFLGGTFSTDTNADGLSDNLTARVSNAGDGAFTRAVDGSNGQYFQIITRTNPVSGNFSAYQKISTGFSVGDTILVRGKINTTFPDGMNSGSTYAQDKIVSKISVFCWNAGGGQILEVPSSDYVSGDAFVDYTFVVPATTASFDIQITVKSNASNPSAGSYVAKFSRMSVLNLTTLGITPV